MTAVHAPLVLDVAGLSLNDDDRRRLQHPLTGGMILFARNWQDRRQLTELTSEAKSVRPDLLICVDHEGGRLFVVGARGLLVAEVALASGEVTYHPLGASAAKGNTDVWWRQAVWVGNGRIAVTGERFRPGRSPEPFCVRKIVTS